MAESQVPSPGNPFDPTGGRPYETPPLVTTPAPQTPPVGSFPPSPKPTSPAPQGKTGASTPGEYKDGTREIVETVVFVVVLVLLLKTFLAEAFVIPTGSMATTLLGYHKDVTCEQCGYRFLVNAHSEAEPDPHDPRLKAVTQATCPNCRYHNPLRRAAGGGGP